MNRFSASLPSRWLVPARLFVLGWILVSVVVQAISLPAKVQSLRRLEPGGVPQTAFYGWTTGQIQQIAQNQGLSPEMFAGTLFSASLICLVCFWAVGGLLFWRRSDTWAGLLAAFILFATGPGFSNMQLSESQAPDWLHQIYLLMAIFTWPTFFVMLYLFPNGKFVPRFTRYLAVLPYFLFFLARFFVKMDTIGSILLIAYALGGLVSQVYRYRKVSTPEEAQQTKWVVFALGVFIGTLPLSFIIPAIFPTLVAGTPAGFWWEFINNGIVSFLVPALLPLAIGASILRYRLWDIDIIIRRTLSYTILTGLLGMVYYGSVVVLQGILTADGRPPTADRGPPSAVVIVITTLAIAALVSPLRKRIQDFIDRRFYRRKYDAEKAMAAFAAIARSEADLERLIQELVKTMQETVQPRVISVWVRKTRPANGASTTRWVDS